MLKWKCENNTLKISALVGVGLLLLILSGGAYGENQSELDWPVVTKECRPWTYWWWMGSAIDEPNITELLEAYRGAGMGGVHIVPIYGVKGCEDRFIDYLSPKWMKMLGHTTSEAKRLDMGVDMTTGTGWPFGGPWLSIEDSDSWVNFKTYLLNEGGKLGEKIGKEQLDAVVAYSDDGRIVKLADRVNPNGVLDWVAPPGKWKVYVVRHKWVRGTVKVAAPGGEGYHIDPLSNESLMKHLRGFNKSFAAYREDMPRAQYHDSYEYWGNWTDDLFDEFKSRRGYDLREYLPEFFSKDENDDAGARVKCDYRQTISELLLERFIVPWVKWCHEKGSLARNQAHCSPGNIIDLYAATDIPETESYGPARFEIPGLHTDNTGFDIALASLFFKFASSAGHLAGRRLISSESCTWLGEHFKVALSHVKPEIDLLLVSGINHVFYHGTTYSPVEEAWPGWLFFASTNFSPSNTFWRDLPELNSYITRCQSFLQSGEPDNAVLLYLPIHEIWQRNRLPTPARSNRMLYAVGVEKIDKWPCTGFYKAAKTMLDKGYAFDYVSDRFLTDVRASSDGLDTGSTKYRVVVVPKCRLMSLETLSRLIQLAQDGATIIVDGNLPSDVPGYGDLTNRRKLFAQVLGDIKFAATEQPDIRKAIVGKGWFLIGDSLEDILKLAGVDREEIVDTGICFIRRTHPQGHYYFLANLDGRSLDGWVTLSVKAESVGIFDPLSTKTGMADVRQGKNGTEVYLQLQPGQSCILKTFSSKKIDGPKWRYLQESGEPYQIQGTWKVTFIEGGPNIPAGFEVNNLSSWTQLGDDEAKRFSGTALYSITFNGPTDKSDEWLLDLGRVCESARVKLNGHKVGTLFSVPFKISVGQFLRKGSNTLEVEVTNLSANRIADMDRRKVYWKKFYDTNFVNIHYEEFDASDWPLMDSGLLGPVRLIPRKFVKNCL